MLVRKLSVTVLVAVSVCLGVLMLDGAPAFAALKTTPLRELTGASTPGKEAWEFTHGGALAVDGFSGDTLVADSHWGVVQVFDPLGNYLATWDGSSTPAKSFGGVIYIAADNATGEVYVADTSDDVIDVLSASGEYIATWRGEGTPAKSFGLITGGITVDQASGRVYVPDLNSQTINVFDAAGTYLFQITGTDTPQGTATAGAEQVSVAVEDNTGEVLVGLSFGGSRSPIVEVFDSAGHYITTWQGLNTPAGGFGENSFSITTNQETSTVLLTSNIFNPIVHVVNVLDFADDYLTPQISLPGEPEPLRGVAVNEATGEVYVEHEGGAVETGVTVLSSVVVPDVATGVSSGSQGIALVKGTVNPDGIKVTSCDFEYGTEASVYANTVECAHTSQIGEGKSAVAVSAEVAGLQPDTLYHFRLAAGNANGTNLSQDGTFFTSTSPPVEKEFSSHVGSAGATVGASIDAAALPTTYRVEYGTSGAYGSLTAEVGAGSAGSAVGVLAQLTGLQAATEYHFRFVVTNALGATFGSDETFTTLSSAGASSSALPDERVYELVASPRPTEDWDVYVPAEECNPALETIEFGCTFRPIQASDDGSSLAFVGDPVPGGNGSNGNGYGNEFMASRGSAGEWSSTVITPPRTDLAGGVYSGFSDDLSTGILASFGNEPLTGEASPSCTTLYSRSSAGKLRALFTRTINAGEEANCFGPKFAGSSADGTHVEFEMKKALTPGAPEGKERNLYDSANGRLSLVNVLPDGKPAGNAKFGSTESVFSSNAVSDDGSRIFWTDLNNGDLYARENSGTPSAKTVLVAEGGGFWTASTDGSLVFFTKSGDLYSFDVDSAQTTDLTPGGEAQGVIGASKDGSYVYFVGRAVLRGAGGASLKNSHDDEPVAGSDNLYVIHGGVTRFVAALDESYATDWLTSEIWAGGTSETEAPDVYRTAEVAPGGNGVVFMSRRGLTGYANGSAREVYVYDADTGRLSCASCNPTGAPPSAGGGFLSLPTGHVHLPRWISGDGSQVFFDSAESLVPQATGGKAQVYEWEQQGHRACRQTGGCIYLLSSGGQEAFFLDASASGEDAFFATRADLVSQDRGSSAVIYDARVNGYRPVSLPACSGTGCQGVPPALPIFATPSSATYEGVGNFPPPSSPPAIKAKKTKVCKKGLVKRKGGCAKPRAKARTKHGRSTRRVKRGSK